MRTIQTAEPRSELREFVRSYAEREITAGDLTVEQSGIASLENILAFDLCDRTMIDYLDRPPQMLPRINIVGAQTFPSGVARFTGNILAFGIFLAPSASARLFRIDPAELSNRNSDGELLFRGPIVELWTRLAESRSFLERIRVAETFLLPYARNAPQWTPIERSARYLFLHQGTTRIDELARHTGLGIRQYERRFSEEMGCAPKLFARITRFQEALDAKRRSQQRSWMSIAHQLGYFDQMHLVRDFQSLGDHNPGEIIQQTGDLQPWSLTASERVSVRCNL